MWNFSSRNWSTPVSWTEWHRISCRISSMPFHWIHSSTHIWAHRSMVTISNRIGSIFNDFNCGFMTSEKNKTKKTIKKLKIKNGKTSPKIRSADGLLFEPSDINTAEIRCGIQIKSHPSMWMVAPHPSAKKFWSCARKPTKLLSSTLNRLKLITHHFSLTQFHPKWCYSIESLAMWWP